MKAGTNMKIAGKTVYVFVLLTITMVMRLTGHNSSALVMTVGNSSVLNCSFKGNIALLKWTITPKAGGLCTLVYRADKNKTHRTTCSDNINLIFRADLPPDLEIRQVGLAQEGNYSCDKIVTNVFLYACIITCVLIIITLLAVIYYFKLHGDRPCHRTKPPEIAPIHSQQDDTMEVEPYTTYVQKENVIYNSMSDLTVGQDLPQDFSVFSGRAHGVTAAAGLDHESQEFLDHNLTGTESLRLCNEAHSPKYIRTCRTELASITKKIIDPSVNAISAPNWSVVSEACGTSTRTRLSQNSL
ncbi:hypothetical protein EK904_001028 [Melospiza melodia maxima]|nr:hypothetical protein EK904_001028 [Melospiza melodia maxima]